MFPFLESIGDGNQHKISEIVSRLSDVFNLDISEVNELLSNGKQKKFENRVETARTHLKQARLLETPDRENVTITSRGVDVLGKNPGALDRKFLMQFPEYVKFYEQELVNRRNAIQLTKGEDRRRNALYLFIFNLPFLLGLVGIASSAYIRIPAILALLSGIAVVFGFFTAALAWVFWFSDIISPLNPVDKAFQKTLKALELLKPFRHKLEESEALLEPNPSLSDDEVRVLGEVYGLLRSAGKDLENSYAPPRMLKEANDLLEDTGESFRTLLLPAIKNNQIHPSTLDNLAALLSTPTLDGLSSFNRELVYLYREDTSPETQVYERFARIWNNRAGQIGLSVGFGYGTAIVATLVFCLLKGLDFDSFTSNNPQYILLGGAGLAAPLIAASLFRNLKQA